MNAVLILVSSAWIAGADATQVSTPVTQEVIPVNATAPAPAGCGISGGCAASSDPCARPGIFSRIKDRFSSKSACCPAPDCAPAPVKIEKPAKAPEPCAAPVTVKPCDPCATAKPGILDRIRAKFRKGSACDSGCEGGCASAAAPTHEVVPAPRETPKAAPKAAPEAPQKVPEKTQAETSPITPVAAPSIEPSPIQIGGSRNPF